ncbi:hypothetical protein D3C80_1731540 [compost metagenome]
MKRTERLNYMGIEQGSAGFQPFDLQLQQQLIRPPVHSFISFRHHILPDLRKQHAEAAQNTFLRRRRAGI